MTLKIPYHWTDIDLSVKEDNSLELTFPSHPDLIRAVFEQVWYSMSYEDLINWLGENTFLNVVNFYHEEYNE